MQHRWVMFKIAGTGKEVVIEGAAEPSSTWDEFIGNVPENECRYGGALPLFALLSKPAPLAPLSKTAPLCPVSYTHLTLPTKRIV